jgi:hypothetical protein
LHDVAPGDGVEGSDRDPACFSLHQDDSSRNVTDERARRTDVEASLVRALDRAADAGRFDVVAQLARELEARRLVHMGNVVAIGRKIRRRNN